MTASGRRRLCLAALSLSLLLAGLAHADATPAKRPLRAGDCDGWRSIQSPQLSRDGKFVAYVLSPQDGDGEVVVRNLATGAEHRHSRGSAAVGPAAPSPGQTPATEESCEDDQFPGRRGPLGPAPTGVPFAFGGGRLAFTADSQRVVFQVYPSRAETEKARKAKAKPEEMPRNGLVIMELATGAVTRIERVRGFQLPESGGDYLAYQREPQRTEEKKPAPPAGPAARARSRVYGSDLVLYRISDKSERVIPDVVEYQFTKDGKELVYVVSSRKEEADGVYTLALGNAGPAATVLAGRGRYNRLTWDEKQTRLAFLSDREDASNQPRFKLYLWERKPVSDDRPRVISLPPLGTATFAASEVFCWALGTQNGVAVPPAVELLSASAPGFRAGWVISERSGLTFSKDGGRLFLFTGPAPEPPREGAEATPADQRVVVDLWHWKDDFIQPMQRVRAEQDRNPAYRAVYDLGQKRFTQLADEKMAGLVPSQDGRWGLGTDDRPYRRLVGQDTSYSDYYLVDVTTASRKPLLTKHASGLTFSSAGKYALYFDGKDWNTIGIPDGKGTNLTAKLGVRFQREEHDQPGPAPAYGAGGWTTDDKYVVLYDRHDVWLAAPDGSGARNLTKGVGRERNLQLRVLRLGGEERALDVDKPLLLSAVNLDTRDEGFYRVAPGNTPVNLLTAARNFGTPVKAKDADVLLLTASTFYDYPDLHVTTPDFKELRRVSDANPQKAGLVWGKAELVRYRNADGVPLSGVLVKPEDFDPAKKYPLIVYIYERLSQNLHRFVDPRPGTSINPSHYASNGYLVLMPDICYTVGYPGQSALKCVLPAIQAVVDQGCVDEKAIGIQGHSWGGYQIAYMVTQTNRFKAASAGAPVANMVSAYDGIRWGSGLPRQFQYERTQSRIGGSLWQYPMRFVENSPIFMADRVQTPLLMLHNDQDDAVPWYQGIEYFLALRRLGKEVYLFNYNGEPHGLRRRANQKDYSMRMQQFFDHHLKGAPMPAWMEKGVPYVERDREKEAIRAQAEAAEKAGP